MEAIQARSEVPAIAYFCSLFKEAFDLPSFDFEELEESLLDIAQDHELILEFLFKVLNGCYGRHDIGTENYDHYLNDIFSYRLEKEQSQENPMKNTTFLQLSAQQKITVLYHLCHFRLDADDVSARLKGLDGDCMRVEPLGVDAKGAQYWYFYGTRLYKEDPKPVLEETKKKTKGKKKQKKAKRRKGKQVQEEESSEEEDLTDLLTKPEDDDDDPPETPAVKKAARLRVNLEKKDDADDAGEEEIDWDLNDDVESLKYDSTDEEEEAIFEDRSSDEDYSEKGSRKQKNGKRKRNNGSKTPKSAKTPTAKNSKVPEILRVTPKSARLRAKFGYCDESSKASNNNDDRQSSSSRSTTRSDKTRNNSRKRRKKAYHVEDSSEKVDDNSVETGSVKPEIGDAKTTAEKTEIQNDKTKQDDDTLSQACDKDVSEDCLEKEMEVETPSDQTQKQASKTLYEDYVDILEVGEMDGSDRKSSTATHPKQNSDSSDPATEKINQKESSQHGTDFKERAIVMDDGGDVPADLKDCLDNTKVDRKAETSSSQVSMKQEDKESRESSAFDPTTSDDSCSQVDMKTVKMECSDEKPTVKVESINNEHPNPKPSENPVRSSLRRLKMEKEDSDSQDSKTSSSSKGGKGSYPKAWEPRQETLVSQKSGWHLVCEGVEDWQHLVTCLEEDDSGSRKQRSLAKTLRENFLPVIPDIQEEKEKERKKREQEMAPRRLSTRLLYKKKEQEDRKRILDEAQLEEDRMKAEEDEERKRRLEEEKREEQRRQQEEKEKARDERARRVKLREERAKLISEGKEIPPELLNGFKNDVPASEEQMLDDEVVAKLHKVLTVCFKDKEAWPFTDSVEEKMAPGYFTVIKMPMNLSAMEEKLKKGQYGGREEFAADMDLIVDNCEQYNGDDHDFSIMANNLKITFEQAMRRFFPVGRAKKEDEDFVVEGKNIQPSGRRFKTRREASRKALDSFSTILADTDDLSDHAEVIKPGGSGSLWNQASNFKGYSSSPSVLVLDSTSRAEKQDTNTPRPTRVVCRPGSKVIEVRTMQPSTSGQAGKPGSEQKVGIPSSVTQGTVMGVLNAPGKDGTIQKVQYLIPASLVSQLKDGKAGEKGQEQRPFYVTINRPQSSALTTVTNSSKLTQVVSTMHQSGGTVNRDKTAVLYGLSGSSAGRSLLKPAVAGSSSLAGVVSSPQVLDGKSLLAVPGNKPVVAASNPLAVVGNSPSVAGNVQLLMMQGKNLRAETGNNQTTVAANSSSAGASGRGEVLKPASQTIQMSKEMCNRLLAENKLKIVQGPGGKSVYQLQPGFQLVSKPASTTLLPKGYQLSGTPVANTLPQGSRAVTTSITSLSQGSTSVAITTTTKTIGVPPTYVATANNSGSVTRCISSGLASGLESTMIRTAAAPITMKKPLVVNPWSVNDKVTTSSSPPSAISSVQAVQPTMSVYHPSTSALPQVAETTSGFISIAPVTFPQKATTVALGVGGFSLTPTQPARTSTTQVGSLPTVIPVLSSPASSVCVTPQGQVFVTTGSVISSASGVQGRAVVHSQSNPPGPSLQGHILHSPATLPQISPVSAPKVIVLPSTPALYPAQRNLFPTLQGDPVSEDSIDAPSLVGVMPQTLSSLIPAAVSPVYTSHSIPTTAPSPQYILSTPSTSVTAPQPASVASLQTTPVTLSSESVSSVAMEHVVSRAGTVVPPAQTVRQPVSAGGPVYSALAFNEAYKGALQASAQKDTASSMVIAASSVQVSLGNNSSVQGETSVPTASRHGVPKSPSVSSSKPVAVRQSRPESCPSSPGKASSSHTNPTSSRGRPQSRKNSGHDSSDNDIQNFGREAEHEAGQGRSRRNVVNRDYKAFAGYSSKSGVGNRRSSGSRCGVKNAEVESPVLNPAQAADSQSSKISPRKRPASSEDDQPVLLLSSSDRCEDNFQDQQQAPPPKVACLSPRTVLNNSNQHIVKKRVVESPAISMQDSQPVVTCGQTAVHTSAAINAASVVSPTIPATSSCDTTLHTLQSSSQSSHHMHSDNKTMNSFEGRTSDNELRESGEPMEVDDVCDPSLSDLTNRSISPSSGKPSGNAVDFNSISDSSAIQDCDDRSPTPKNATGVLKSRLSSMMPPDHSVFQQCLSDTNSSTE